MALRRGASGSRIRLSRPMVIVIGALALLLLAVVVLGLTVFRGGRKGPAQVPSPIAAATETPEAVAKAEPYPTATVALATPTPLPTQVPPEPTALPAATATPTLGVPTPVPTMVPPPTRPEVAIAPTVTPLPAGGQLPATSGGGPWLLVLGAAFAILLAAVLWWRWRRARAAG